MSIEVGENPFAQDITLLGVVNGKTRTGALPRPWVIAWVENTFWSLNQNGQPTRSSLHVQVVFQGASVVDRVRPILQPNTLLFVRGSLCDLGIMTNGEVQGLAIQAGNIVKVGVRNG